MSWVAAAIGGSAALSAGSGIFSSILGNSQAQKSAKALMYSADKASETALNLNDRSRKDLEPFRTAGADATKLFSNLLTGNADIEGLTKFSKLFQFGQTMGERNINRNLAARGLWGSGAGLETLAKFNADLESQIGSQYMGNVFNLAQLGENAAAQTASNNTATANTVGQVTMQGATGAANANLAGAQFLTQGVNSGVGAIAGGLQNWGQYQMYQPMLNAITNRLNAGNAPGAPTGLAVFNE